MPRPSDAMLEYYYAEVTHHAEAGIFYPVDDFGFICFVDSELFLWVLHYATDVVH